MSIRVQTIKLFHLIKDNTLDVPQKVFLLEDQLKRVKSSFRTDSKIVGLIGTELSIKGYIHKIQLLLRQDKKEEQEEKEEEVMLEKIELEFPLETDENAAIFMIHLQGKNVSTVFLAFVTKDDFYYVKPYSPKSITYLLLRFLGDLCEDIILLYDQKIEKEFEDSDCPYALTENKFSRFSFQEQTSADVPIVQIKFDTKKLFNFDENYDKKIRFDIPIENRYIVYSSKVQKEHYEDRFKKQILQSQEKLWRIIFREEKIANVDNILFQIGKEAKNNRKQMIKQVIEIYKMLKSRISSIGQKCYFECQNIYNQKMKKSSWKLFCLQYISQIFNRNLYSYTVVQSQIDIKQNEKIKKRMDKIVIRQIIKEILYEKWNSLESFDFCYSIFYNKVTEKWNQIKGEIDLSIKLFFHTTNKFFNSQEEMINSEQMMELTLFPLLIIRKQNEIHNICVGDDFAIPLYEDLLKEKVGIPNLDYIKKINVFDLKSEGKAKLLWISLHPNKNELCSVMLTVSGRQIRIFKKYYKQNLSFAFSVQKQRGYLLEITTSKLTYFNIDLIGRITDENTIYLPVDRKDNIISFGVTYLPLQKLFYLTKKANILYGYDFSTQTSFKCFHSIRDRKYLTSSSEEEYEYIRTFSEDLYVVLGNRKFIDIIHPDINGKIISKKRIQVDSTSFLGTTILSDKNNEFLIIHDTTKPRAYLFENMKCDNIFRAQQNEEDEKKGNPIIDIFYEAFERFGQYKDENNMIRDLNLYHLTNLPEQKLKKYLEIINIPNHRQKFYEIDRFSELYYSLNNIVRPKSFMEILLTRIPIQLCTLEDGNLSPLIKGKKENNRFLEELSVAQRSKILDFGIIEEILLQNPQKKVIVVSVMGAQSTGKSYLMNRIFGTRFTVASARTTIGIWLSLIKTSNLFFLLLDCEGLFAPDRTPKEEEKLIKVLASLSDYTIFNLNMSLANRSFIQLMDQISQSAAGIKKSTKNKNLFLGQLTVVVRDVNEPKALEKQFAQMIQTQSKNFFRTLFQGSVNFCPLNHFKTSTFSRDIRNLLEQFKKQRKSKKVRFPLEILESLKVVITQLSCDDSQQFEKNLQNLKIQKAKEQMEQIWMNGESNENRKVQIRGKQFYIKLSSIVIGKRKIQKGEIQEKQEQIYTEECFTEFDKIFQEKIIADSPLKTSQFREIYTLYNDFIQDFFQKRYEAVEKKKQEKLTQDLRMVHEEIKINKLNSVMRKINENKKSLSFCLDPCSKCKLPCIHKKGHKENINYQRDNLKAKKQALQSSIKTKEPNEEQKEQISEGLEIKKEKCKIQLDLLQKKKELLKKDNEFNMKIRDKNQNKRQKQNSIQQASDHIKFIQKEILINSLGEVLNHFQQLSQLQKEEDLWQKIINNYLSLQKQTKEENFSENTQCTFIALNNEFESRFSLLTNNQKRSEEQLENEKVKKNDLNSQIRQFQCSVKKCQTNEKKKEQEKSNSIKKKEKLKDQIKRLDESLKQIQNNYTLKTEEENTYQKQRIEQDRKKEEVLQQKRKQEEEKENLQQILLKKLQTDENIMFQNLFSQYQKVYQKTMSQSQKQKLKKSLLDIKQQLKISEEENVEKVMSECQKKIKTWINKIEKMPQQKEKFLAKVNSFEEMLTTCKKYVEVFENTNQNSGEIVINCIEETYGQNTIQIFDELCSFNCELKQEVPTVISDEQMKIIKFLKEKQLPKQLSSRILQIQCQNDISTEEELNKKLVETELRWKQEDDDQQLKKFEQEMNLLKKEIDLFQIEKQFKKWDEQNYEKKQINKKIMIPEMVNQIIEKYKEKHSDFEQPESIELTRNYQQEIQKAQNQLHKLNSVFSQSDDDEQLEKTKKEIEFLKTKLTIFVGLKELIKHVEEKVQENCLKIIQELNEEGDGGDENITINFNKNDCSVVIEETNEKLNQKFNEYYKLNYQKKCQVSSVDKSLQLLYPSTMNELTAKLQKIQVLLPKVHKKIFLKQIRNKVEKEEGRTIQKQLLLNIVVKSLIPIFSQQLQKMKRQCEEKISKVQLKIQNLNSELNSFHDYSTEFNNVKNEKQKLKENKEAKEKERLKKKKQQLEKEEQIKKLMKQIDQIKGSIWQINQSIRKKQKQIENVSNNINTLATELQFILKLLLEIEKIKDKKLQSTVKEYKQEFKINKEKKGEIQSLNQELNEIIKQLQQLRKESQQLKVQIGDSKQEDINQKIKKLNDTLDNLDDLQKRLQTIKDEQVKLESVNEKIKQLAEDAKLSCSCETNHHCNQNCQSPSCSGKNCKHKAGHQGNHLCEKQDHKCGDDCQFNENCKKKCELMFNHKEKHSCLQDHQCDAECKYCKNKCKLGKFDNHETHNCQAEKCSDQCILCGQSCASNNHAHEDQLDTVQIIHYKTHQKVERKLHLCNATHTCKNLCTHEGICSNKYTNKDSLWKKGNSEIPFTYTEQTQVKQECGIIIPFGQYKHTGPCYCKAKHLCPSRCPDCRSICSLEVGHSGKHTTQHRNQEFMVYASQDENQIIRIEEQKKIQKEEKPEKQEYIFNIGDVSTPTTCYGSCERKGRGHYHLIECKGGEQCLERKWGQGAKHSDKTYKPYIDKQYDMVLCKAYWDYFNFESPNFQREEQYSRCNFVCSLKHEGQLKGKKIFCQSVAWHSFSNNIGDHDFECGGMHSSKSFKKLEICFLIDVTGSMSNFIEQCKLATKTIIENAKKTNPQIQISFAVVGYRDHEMSKSSITKKLKALIPQKQQKLKQLPHHPLYDVKLPEVKFHTLLIKLEQKYESLKKTSENLREQFSQNQRFILDYHYPFPFDVPECSEDFIYPGKKLKMLFELFPLLLGVSSEKSFKQHLLQSLDFYRNLFESEEKEEMEKKNQYKLIQQLTFTNEQKCIQFLDKLDADGGGDPPEAVLDGMEAATKLNWSLDKNTMRYIFHIFDAPPHGKIYCDGIGDRFPDGCPCQKTHEPIIDELNNKDINYVVLSLTPRINQALEIFEGSGLKFKKLEIDKENPQEFTFYVSDEICKQIEQNEILIQKKE